MERERDRERGLERERDREFDLERERERPRFFCSGPGFDSTPRCLIWYVLYPFGAGALCCGERERERDLDWDRDRDRDRERERERPRCSLWSGSGSGFGLYLLIWCPFGGPGDFGRYGFGTQWVGGGGA